jgi:hypothetical protein
MRRRILAIAILSVTTSPAAFAKDLPLMGTQADESGNSATLEIVDQKNHQGHMRDLPNSSVDSKRGR